MGFVCTALLAAAVIAMAMADDATQLKEGHTYCPAPIVGTRCPDANIFSYYKCCGTLDRDCCFQLKDWTVVTLWVLGVLINCCCLVAIVVCIVACCRYLCR